MLVRACELAASSESYTDPVITDIRNGAGADDTYQLLVNHVSTGFLAEKQNVSPTLLDFWKINHVISSQGYLQSNGHVEANVKKVKYLTV